MLSYVCQCVSGVYGAFCPDVKLTKRKQPSLSVFVLHEPVFFFLYTCADRTALICYITASAQPAHERRCTRIQGEPNFRRTFGCFNCESRAKLKIVSQLVYDCVDNRGKWSYRVFSAWFSLKKHQTCFRAAIVDTGDLNEKFSFKHSAKQLTVSPIVDHGLVVYGSHWFIFILRDSQFANPSHTVTP